MGSAFHIEHEDGRREIVDTLGEAIKKLIEIAENEEHGTVRWSS